LVVLPRQQQHRPVDALDGDRRPFDGLGMVQVAQVPRREDDRLLAHDPLVPPS
jgi:hypothetical protein